MSSTEITSVDPAQEERNEIVEQLHGDPERQRLSFVEWFLQVDGQMDAAEARIKEQAERMLAYIKTRRAALHWKYGADFRQQVESDLSRQSGKKKSIDYLTGRAGFRTRPSKVIVGDKAKLTNWCAVNLPEAVPMRPELHVTPIKKYIEETGDVPPGCGWRQAERAFYPNVNAPALEEGGDEAGAE